MGRADRGTIACKNVCQPGDGVGKMMEYRGYLAAVEYDDSVEVLHGRVMNSGPHPIATFEATDTRELPDEFKRSVDEYLAWCDEDGVEPIRPL